MKRTHYTVGNEGSVQEEVQDMEGPVQEEVQYPEGNVQDEELVTPVPRSPEVPSSNS